jgi:hypothetical protein
LIQPVLADDLPATETEVCEFGEAVDPPFDYVLSVSLGASQNIGHFFDG